MAAAKKKVIVKLINIRKPFNEAVELPVLVASYLNIKKENVTGIRILRKSIDARQQKIDLVYMLAVELWLGQEGRAAILKKAGVTIYREAKAAILKKVCRQKTRPLVIGCGPAGLFAALALVERGAKPLLLERGACLDQRIKDVDHFWKHGKVNAESNVFFGEGGAGTFSDGKLTTRIKSSLKEKVFKELVKAGAPEDLLYLHKPHLGTDRIREVVKCLVESLKRKGVDVLFNTRVDDIKIEKGRVLGVIADGNYFPSETVFLAMGHSARDSYALLQQKGVALVLKGFAVGLRIEHPQAFIDQQRWGQWSGHPALGAADYFFAFKDEETGRGVYTFCMCPGGYVIACSSEPQELVTNGMSTYKRNAPWANAAVVVTVRTDDFASQDPLQAFNFQQELEKKAFFMGGANFYAPAQKAKKFLDGTAEHERGLACSYRPGILPADLNELLPVFVREPLKRALRHFDKKMPGFIEQGILLGVETRTSSPVRILRSKKNYHSAGLRGLIPIGEGSGYAGGIVSSAVDGILAAVYFDA